MDVIIVCHTEFGFVDNKNVIYDKNVANGVKDGVSNLIKIADKYGAKVTFAVCPEVVDCFPKDLKHEVGLHLHPGWQEFSSGKFRWFVGDEYLRKECSINKTSTSLRDYTHDEQFKMIKAGRDYISDKLGKIPKVFVAGRWSLNSDTIKALIENGFTHDCSAPAHSKTDHYDWSKIPRICNPYRPSADDYQASGDSPILILPIAQTIFGGTVNPEGVTIFGLPWLKACFKEYKRLGAPLFHICLHSPSMTDKFFISVMADFLSFIAKQKDINFKFASEIKESVQKSYKSNFFYYLPGINRQLIKTALTRFFRNGV